MREFAQIYYHTRKSSLTKVQYAEEYRVVDQIYQKKPREKAKNIWFCAKIRLDFSRAKKNKDNHITFC